MIELLIVQRPSLDKYTIKNFQFIKCTREEKSTRGKMFWQKKKVDITMGEVTI